jgi:hypothetical protein
MLISGRNPDAPERCCFFKPIGPTAKYCVRNRKLLLTHLSVVDTPPAPRVMIFRTSAKSPEQISQSRHCGQEGGV